MEKFDRPPVFSHKYPSHHVMITSCSQLGDCNAKIDSMLGDVWSPTMMLIANTVVTVWSYCFGNDAKGSAVGLSCCHMFATVTGSSPDLSLGWRMVFRGLPRACWNLYGKHSFSVTTPCASPTRVDTERLAERETLLHRLGSKLNRIV